MAPFNFVMPNPVLPTLRRLNSKGGELALLDLTSFHAKDKWALCQDGSERNLKIWVEEAKEALVCSFCRL